MNKSSPLIEQIAHYSPQDVLLADVAVRIQLSPTDYQRATRHYEVMGEWLDRPGSPLRGLVDEFYPQGGFSTGSVIASHSDKADFDLDAMAAIRWPYNIDPEVALATTHQAIAGEKGSRYHDKAERMTRCTQVTYDGMHLDVTPSILIPGRLVKTSLIFHSKPSDATVPKKSLYANPYGLSDWYNKRTQIDIAFGSFFEKASLDYARGQLILQKADTAPVPAQLPAYRKSRQTICLQLIKRWRNVLYDRSYKHLRLPPSVLLTYYVGSHTGLTRSLTDELIHHVESIHAKLKAAHDIARRVHEVNPTCEEDILTDRWPGNLNEQNIFMTELVNFLVDLRRLKAGMSLADMQRTLERLFGEKPARDAVAAFTQQHVSDNAAGKGLYVPGRGSMATLGSIAAPSTARAMPRSTPYGD